MPKAEFSLPSPWLVEENGHVGFDLDSCGRGTAPLSGMPKKGFAALSGGLAG